MVFSRESRIEGIPYEREVKVNPSDEDNYKILLFNSSGKDCMRLKDLDARPEMDRYVSNVKLNYKGEDIGFYSLTARDFGPINEGELMYRYLIPEVRNQGFGELMLRFGLIDLLKYGNKRDLKIERENEGFSQLLESLGFNYRFSETDFPHVWTKEEVTKPKVKKDLTHKLKSKDPKIEIKTLQS